jgi:short-subunit dehydrogenase
MQLKTLSEQVVVITGASSGIGLTTARMAASRGARVVLTARDADALRSAVSDIESQGGRASFVAADVTDPDAMHRVAEHAISTYGTIDTWVNNAGISVYGRVEEVALADMRQLFDVTFWGVVHGCLAALPRLKPNGGALINIGSVESDVAIPLTAAYAAAKHAVKGFTDALRMELEHEGAPIAVSLVKPGSIDTPFFEHAKNYLEGSPKPPPPVYAPETVGRAVLECAVRPIREVYVGGAGRMQVGMARHLPRTTDRLFANTMFRAQQTRRPTRRDREGALYAPDGNGRQRGEYRGRVMEHSAYTYLSLHPVKSALVAATVGAALVGAARMVGGTA